VLQPQGQALGARTIMPITKSSKAAGRRGCASGCGHQMLELSCHGVGARPAGLAVDPGQRVY